MSRFEKKCFIGSAAFHGLLLVVFVCGAAFLPSRKAEELPPVITIFGQVTDRPIAGGGNPNVTPTPTPPAAPPERQPIQPPPPKPETAPPKQVEKPEPKIESKPQVKARSKPEVKKDAVEKETKKDDSSAKSLISKTIVRRTNDTERIQREASERQAREREQNRREMARLNEQRRKLANEVGSIISGARNSVSKAPVVEAGPGGEAYVNYGSLVGEIYKQAVHATNPQSDQDAEASIKIVVARNGTVRSSRWVRRTGNSVLDKSVDRAMNSVRSLPQFPAGTKDLERSFNITIAFEAKRVSA